MINFHVPEDVTSEVELAKMVAEQVMRSKSRYYDEHEHERPLEYINIMWPVIKEQEKKRFERASNGSRQEASGPRNAALRLVMLVEMFSWGDAGQYLSTPNAALGGAAVQAVGTREQQQRFLKRFTEGEPKWGAMAMTESGAGSDTTSSTR